MLTLICVIFQSASLPLNMARWQGVVITPHFKYNTQFHWPSPTYLRMLRNSSGIWMTGNAASKILLMQDVLGPECLCNMNCSMHQHLVTVASERCVQIFFFVWFRAAD